ncbi:hypothetical protein B0H17DRAFT_1197450 [Mycena rosella]|uniref:Major facilitator superfamily (MFS) profile domain-containing protein n=1 Tax=Mycena rosella TaxID=1033263 RepID=A0AAD7GJ36_MYCRO|nr:hypothetical protein B0H17DRAFT_1197450 [Mycena rosella]
MPPPTDAALADTTFAETSRLRRRPAVILRAPTAESAVLYCGAADPLAADPLDDYDQCAPLPPFSSPRFAAQSHLRNLTYHGKRMWRARARRCSPRTAQPLLIRLGGRAGADDGQKGNTNVAGANAYISFIFLFGLVYAITYTPLQALYCAEVMSQDMRAKGMAVHILISNIAGFINMFANSVGLANLNWRYYFVYAWLTDAWDVVASALWYFLDVETLDVIFDAPWPARASTQKVVVKLKADGSVDVLEKPST